MRKTIIECDVCGEDQEKGPINTYAVTIPHMYQKSSVMTIADRVPHKEVKFDAHEACSKLVAESLKTAWNDAIDALKRDVFTAHDEEGVES